ncbi:Nuclear receptor 2DBD gamma [Fasciola gigantica]|uniref:Nuclear receptor 2DBD gamma n=1 Tax=Fasciola gigantica TaxID=46835 RepID=A0A504YTU6_FASGI|nr:Nuclear receptor 2DBD gamma [Fasciola gigantica]
MALIVVYDAQWNVRNPSISSKNEDFGTYCASSHTPLFAQHILSSLCSSESIHPHPHQGRSEQVIRLNLPFLLCRRRQHLVSVCRRCKPSVHATFARKLSAHSLPTSGLLPHISLDSMSVPSEDNSCCVSEYSCSSTPHLNHPHALNHITNSNPPSHQGPLACRPESNECPPTNGGFSSGHLPFHHATSETNATTSTIASSSSSLSTINPGNATTSSTASLSPTPDHNADNQNHHLFYSSGSNCATYPSSHTESRINTDIVLSRPESHDDANISEKTSIAQPLSVLPPSFQIKQENNLSPPTRSISVHSLPSSLISPYQLGVTSSTIALPGLDPFILSKREFIDDSELTRRDESDLSGLSYTGNNNSNINNNNMVSLSQNPHTMGYVTCSSFDPHRSAVLSQSHLIGTCLLPDSSSHMSLFSSHRATTLSPLPLTVAIGADSNTTQGPSGRIHRNPMNSTHSDVNSGVPMHLDSPSSTQHLNPFEVTGGESGFACLLPPTSSSATTVDSVNKRVNSHGNGMCMNPGPCDLSAPNVPIGLSPRSKARRYSYPYEPIGLSKSFTKDFQLPDQDRSSHSCLSPGLFRIIGSSNGNNTVNNNMGNVNNYHSVGLGSSSGGAGDCGLTSVGVNGSGGGGGGRTLSTPMSSCGGEDVHQSGPLIGEHMHDQKPFMPSDDDVTLPGFSSPESAFYQYQHRMEGQRCQVCGELAAGFHHGAYVCEACKKFFMRHSLTDTKPTNVCPTGGNCVVAKGSRGKCQICRYRKCLYVGMKMKDPDSQPELDISNIPCRVCGGRSSGFHFGALTCEGCKGFFRRTEGSAGSLVCVGGQNACTITPRSRNACKSCRFRRCIAAGMSKKGSRIGRQPNAVKFHCAIEIRQLRSIRGNYSSHMDIHGGLLGTPGPTTSAGPSAYTPFSVDIGQTMDTVTNPGSLHNRSDVESPKYSPDTLTSTYANRRDPNVWVNDQKPPLSLLLFLPRTSDPIDVTSSCSNTSGPNTNVAIGDSIGGGGHRAIETGVYLSQDVIKPSQFSPPTSYHSTVLSGPPFDRFNLDTVCLRQSSSMVLSADSAGFGGTQSCREAYLPKNEDDILGNADSSLRCGPADRLTSSEDDPHSVSHQHDSIKSLDAYPSPVSLALHSLLAPFGYLGRLNRATSTPDVTGNGHTLDEDNSCGLHNLESGSTGLEAIDDNQTSSSEPGPGAQTAELITDLAQRLAEEEQEGMVGDELEPDDGTGCPPSHEAVLRFIDGMRTATEFLRLPNTYFKTRFRMSTIPLDQYEKDVQVWSHMMNHFHMHAQQIVQFAKLVPGELSSHARFFCFHGLSYFALTLGHPL